MAHNLPAIQQKALTLKNYLHQPNIKKAIEDSLPKWLSVERFLRVIFTATMKNPKIVECSLESILQSVISASQLGLEPILGRAYLIPYNNSKLVGNKWVKVMECQFQPGYQGLIDLARRTNTIRDVYAMNVFENDEFDLTFGTDRKIHHRPWYLNKENKESGDIIGVYAVWEMKDGTKHPEFMTISDVYKRRDRSQAYQYAMANPNKKSAQDCPWIVWPEEMIIKTIIKHSSKLVPASIDFMQAVALDETVETGKSQLGMFSDNPEYNGLLPESSGAIDVTPKEDSESDMDAEPDEDDKPKTDPAFAAIVEKEAGKKFEYVATKDGMAHDLLSAYLEVVSKNQTKETTPYEIMENVSDPGIFPGFWNGFKAGTWQHHFEGALPKKPEPAKEQKKQPENTFKGHRSSQEGPPDGLKMDGSKKESEPPEEDEDESTSPFDVVDWKANGMKKVGTQRYWDANKGEWASANKKAEFEEKWIRVFTMDGTLTKPCPWKTEEQKPVETEAGSTDEAPTREPGDEPDDQSLCLTVAGNNLQGME